MVRSTCLDPSAHPAQESTTRTKTHFCDVWHTEMMIKCTFWTLTVRSLTLKEFEALGLGSPAGESKSSRERSILMPTECVYNGA